MTAIAASPVDIARPLRRFFRTPKGVFLILLASIAAVAVGQEGVAVAAPGLAVATITAAAFDVTLHRYLRGEWIFPSGAILTGLIVGLILAPQEPAAVEIATAGIAIASKYVFYSRWSNIFNPAAFALVASYFLFDSAQSWWGALPDSGLLGVLLLVGAGYFIADRINKIPMVIMFLGTYFTLFALGSFIVPPGTVAELFRSPDLQAVLFFAFFMLDDPPTCPVKYTDQAQYAIVVALVSYTLFITVGALYFLPAGLLAGNAWETARRYLTRRRPAANTALAA